MKKNKDLFYLEIACNFLHHNFCVCSHRNVIESTLKWEIDMNKYFYKIDYMFHGLLEFIESCYGGASVVADEQFSINYPKLPT